MGAAIILACMTGAAPVAMASDSSPCLDATTAAEARYPVPKGVLAAIARIESGRAADSGGRAVPWPWTVNAAGVPLYLDTKADAVMTVRDLLIGGEINIDIGCMQVNLSWHGDSFRTLEDVFDPASNVDYAARHLIDLYNQEGDWLNAIGRYHSGDADRKLAYLQRLGAAMGGRLPPGAPPVSTVERMESPTDRAATALAAGQVNIALGHYQAALKSSPDDRTALLGHAVTLDRLGRTTEALTAWKQALIVMPTDQTSARRLAGLVQGLPLDRRLVTAAELAGIAPRNAVILALHARALADHDKPAEAAALARTAAAMAPDDADMLLNAAVLSDRASQPDEAIAHYRRFLDRRPMANTLPDDRTDTVRRRITYLHTLVQG